MSDYLARIRASMVTRSPQDELIAFNHALLGLVGHQLQVIALAYPVDLAFPSEVADEAPTHIVRIESPFSITRDGITERIEPGNYQQNIITVVALLWRFVAHAGDR